MGKVIITGFTAKSEGVVLETNVPAKLKTGNVKGKSIWVSWDKIGKLLFEDYVEIDDVASRDLIRNNYSLKQEVDKRYCIPDEVNTKEDHIQYLKDIKYKTHSVKLLSDNKWQVVDDSDAVEYQGSLSDCESWIRFKEQKLI